MRSRLILLIYTAFLLLAFAAMLLERGNLGDPLPLVVTVFGGLAGGLCGWLALAEAFSIKQPEGGVRRIIGMAALVLFGALAGVGLTQSLAVRAAFAGVSSKAQPIKLEVEDRDRARRRRMSSSRYRIVLRLPDGGREIRVVASRALYDKVGAKPAPGEHCIVLPVETGRWGIRRVWAPNDFDTPLDLADYRACGGAGAF